MKTAVSIPDKIFESAERLARRQGTSRSRLYAQAIKSYVEKQDNEAVMNRLNEVYAGEDSSLDPALRRTQRRALPREQW